jgi:hypothetical protein
MVYIYILNLERDKYYIGKTNNPNFRLEQHFSNEGANWTKIYKPIGVEQIIENCDDYDEDKYTLKYMGIFGIENVRGGSFCEHDLSIETKKLLQKMLLGSTNKCFNCGSDSHFVETCPKKITKKTNTYKKKPLKKFRKLKTCQRCNRMGHNKRGCYAKTNKEGIIITS